MESNDGGRHRNLSAELGAQLVWVVGVLGSYDFGAAGVSLSGRFATGVGPQPCVASTIPASTSEVIP